MRLTVAVVAVMCALCGARAAGASSASAAMSVGVTVVRSCAVQSRAIDDVSASLRVACSAGHRANVLVGDAQLTAPRSVVRVTPAEEPGSPGSVRVVTLNF